MTPNERPQEPVLTRRALRRGGVGESSAQTGAPHDPSRAREVHATEVVGRPATSALAWVRDDGTSDVAATPPDLDSDLVTRWPRRSPRRGGVLVPLGVVLGLLAAYVIAMLVWPLTSVLPRVESIALQNAAGTAAAPGWPPEGSAAIGVEGFGTTVASSTDAVPMASISKLITALVVLDSRPLALGEQGPAYEFTRADRTAYRNTLAANESALDVPVGGTLTQYQMLEGLLIGSAGNYADRLVADIFPSEAAYVRAAMQWLTAQGLTGITVVDTSGISPQNTAAPAALIALAERALADPVIAEIVAKPSVDLPGAGLVENTNALLGDPGVVGVKTGLLFSDYNLLAARDVTIGDTTVRGYAVVLGQPDSDTRFARARELLTGLDAQLSPTVAIPEGAVVGSVVTPWADPVNVVASTDAALILWNGATSAATSNLFVGTDRAAGSAAGIVTVTGPLGSVEIEAELAEEVTDPSPWWRLTHPLVLTGLRAA